MLQYEISFRRKDAKADKHRPSAKDFLKKGEFLCLLRGFAVQLEGLRMKSKRYQILVRA